MGDAIHEARRLRAALVVGTILVDVGWVRLHIPILAALGLPDFDERFYAAYQAGRCLIAAIGLLLALRLGLFDRSELGLSRNDGGGTLRVVTTVTVVAAALLIPILTMGLPEPVCDLITSDFWNYPWSRFCREFIYFVFVAPIYEEIVYRALLLSTLRDFLSKAPALAASSVAFMVLHKLYGYGWNPGYILGAMALGWTFLRCGSLLPGIALHAANNLWYTTSSYGRQLMREDRALLEWLCG